MPVVMGVLAGRIGIAAVAGAGLIAGIAVGGAVSATATTVTVVAGKPTESSLRLTPKTVPAGTVVFKVQNQGKKPHRFVICSSPKGGSAGSCPGKGTPVLAPGKSASLTVTLASGRFEYLDTTKGGAKGILVVSAATTTPVSSPTPTPTTPSGGSTGGTTTTTPTGTTVGSGSSTLGDVNAGRQIFTSVGCTGCHTLVAVGSTGGISLDDLKPSLAVAIDNITNGNALGMPAWDQTLTKTQIQNVAAFVFCATNKGAAGC